MATPITFTVGVTYKMTYHPTLYGKPVTKVLTVTAVLPSAMTKTVTLVCKGPRGGKVCLTAADVITAEAAEA